MLMFWGIMDALSRLCKWFETIVLRGELEVVAYDGNGNVKYRERKHNVITNVGKADVAGLIGGLVTSPFNYIAIGSSSAPPSASDTSLGSEVARKSASASRETTNVTNDTLVLVATFSSADGLSGTSDIVEAGVFNASTGGDMLARQTFSKPIPMDWDAGDAIQITWKIVVQ